MGGERTDAFRSGLSTSAAPSETSGPQTHARQPLPTSLFDDGDSLPGQNPFGETGNTATFAESPRPDSHGGPSIEPTHALVAAPSDQADATSTFAVQNLENNHFHSAETQVHGFEGFSDSLPGDEKSALSSEESAFPAPPVSNAPPSPESDFAEPTIAVAVSPRDIRRLKNRSHSDEAPSVPEFSQSEEEPSDVSLDKTAEPDERAVMLRDLEESLRNEDEVPFSPFEQDEDDQGFGALEAAFDEAAAHPTDPSARALPEPSEPEANTLDGIEAPEKKVAPIPPKDVRSPMRPPHLSLTRETHDRASVPLENPPAHVRLTRKQEPEPPAPEAGGLFADAPQRGKTLVFADDTEEPMSGSDPVQTAAKTERKKKRKKKKRTSTEVAAPRKWIGTLPALGLCLVGLMLGLGLGAVLAPAEETDASPQARAQQEFIDGNRHFADEDFAAAVESYQNATTLDENHAAAYRALGVSFVNMNRMDDAKTAYEAYLKVVKDTESVDAKLVAKTLAAYKKK